MKPITWAFEAQTYASDGAYPFSNPIGAYQSTVLAAVNKWISVANIPLVQVADAIYNTVAPDIRIGFGALHTGSTGTIGVTSYHYSNNLTGQAFAPDTLVRLEDPSELAVSATGDYTGTSASLYQVALHEIGHALGLAHSTDPNSVMYAVVSASNHDLNIGDIAGIQALYGPAATTPMASTGTTIQPANVDWTGLAGQQLVDMTSSLLAPAPTSAVTPQFTASAPMPLMFNTDETKTTLIPIHLT